MNFDDILGNEKVKEYLDKSIDTKDILHSYLFLGNSGIGKKLIAEEFARKILCLKDGKQDCNCKSCITFKSNNNMDFKLLDLGNEQIKIDVIRDVINSVYQKPIESNRKVYIINNFENANTASQNCLLKTLEEPPEYVTIILISSNENMLLNTIKSRCMTIYFQKIEQKKLKNYAITIAGYSDNLSENLLNAFDGSIGKIYEYKDYLDNIKSVDSFIEHVNNKSLVEIINYGKIFYDKENSSFLLNYLVSSLFLRKNDVKYLNCISIANEALERVNSKIAYNLDMTIDNMLIKMWEEFN